MSATDAVIIVLATEMTIKWNNIQGVNNLQASGQLVPLFVSIGLCARVVWVSVRNYRSRAIVVRIPEQEIYKEYAVTSGYSPTPPRDVSYGT